MMTTSHVWTYSIKALELEIAEPTNVWFMLVETFYRLMENKSEKLHTKNISTEMMLRVMLIEHFH